MTPDEYRRRFVVGSACREFTSHAGRLGPWQLHRLIYLGFTYMILWYDLWLPTVWAVAASDTGPVLSITLKRYRIRGLHLSSVVGSGALLVNRWCLYPFVAAINMRRLGFFVAVLRLVILEFTRFLVTV